MLKVSMTLVVGVDITEKDEAVVVISKHNGSSLKIVKMLTGQDALDMYEKLTSINNEEENENE